MGENSISQNLKYSYSSLERKLVILHRNEEKDQPWMRKFFVENKSLFQSCHKRQLKSVERKEQNWTNILENKVKQCWRWNKSTNMVIYKRQ